MKKQKQNWSKKTLSYFAGLLHLRMFTCDLGGLADSSYEHMFL